VKFIALAGFEGLLPGRQCESDEKRKVMEREKNLVGLDPCSF